MRIAVVFFSEKKRDKLLNVAKGLANGFESQGHQVDLIDGSIDVNTKLTIYGYIAIGTVGTTSLGGNIPEKIGKYLSTAGIVAGKRCFAFVLKEGLRTGKTLAKLMQTMEHEGMYLKYSEILSSKEEAEAIGKKLHTG